MNAQEFLIALAADGEAIMQRNAPVGVTACACCGIPLQESLTGNRTYADGSHVCSDCYFDDLGDEIETTPIGALRVVRGA